MIANFRNRLIAITTGFVAIVLVAAFVTIYVVSYLRVQSDNQEKLQQAEELHITGGELQFGNEQPTNDALVVSRLMPGSGVYFNMLVDNNGTITLIDSALTMSQQEFEEAAAKAWKNRSGGTVTFADRDWQYLVTPAVASLDYDGQQQISEYDDTYLIRFLDITDTKQSLTSLAITLSLVGVALLGFFFLVILFFANRAMKPMIEAWEKQQQFITDASHELKTPLSIILANTDVLYAHQTDTIQAQIKWLNYISTGARRMDGLVNSLLSQARMDNTKQPLPIQETALDALVQDVLDTYEHKLSKKEIQLHTSLAQAIIKTEPGMVRNLVDILIDNAFKYTNAKGTIEVLLTIEKHAVVLAVTNTGDGIAAQHLPKLFDRFYRGDEARHSQQSYGLGLSIAKSITDRLGGDITVDSIPSMETSFTVTLPKAITALK